MFFSAILVTFLHCCCAAAIASHAVDELPIHPIKGDNSAPFLVPGSLANTLHQHMAVGVAKAVWSCQDCRHTAQELKCTFYTNTKDCKAQIFPSRQSRQVAELPKQGFLLKMSILTDSGGHDAQAMLVSRRAKSEL